VSPAFIMTPLVAEMIAMVARGEASPQEAQVQFLANNRPHIELRRPGRIEEVASAVVFLASERASFIAGTDMRVDGGSVASL
jgi:3-oxoacyl-[acyl-carrier protein] reductase